MHNRSNSDKYQNSPDPTGNKYHPSQTHLKFCLLGNINSKSVYIKGVKFYLLIFFFLLSAITLHVDSHLYLFMKLISEHYSFLKVLMQHKGFVLWLNIQSMPGVTCYLLLP